MVSDKECMNEVKKGIDLSSFSFLIECILSLVNKALAFFGLYFFDWLWRWGCSHGPSDPSADA